MKRWQWILTTLLFVILAWRLFSGINTRPVELWDESTNIAVVKASLNSENPLLLSLHGEAFIEKPPLWYWGCMSLAGFFKTDDLTVFRIISVLAGFFSCLLVFELVRRRQGISRALIALALLVLVNQLFVVNSSGYFSSHTLNTADLDALQIFFIVLASFLLLYKKEPGKVAIVLSFLALSFGFLVKGPLVVIPVIINTWLLIRAKVSYKNIFWGLLIFLIPIVTWCLIMYSNYGGLFIDSFWQYHVFNRTFSILEEHQEVWWFYWQIFFNPVTNLPGIFVALDVIISFIRPQKPAKLTIYAGLMMFTILILLSLVGTKLAWYILPVYFFEAIFLASSKNLKINVK